MDEAPETWIFDDYDPHLHAWDFFCDDHRFALATAGRRAAKTHTGAHRFARKVLDDRKKNAGRPYNPPKIRRGTAAWWKRRPRLHYWIAANELKQLEEPRRYLYDLLPRQLIEHIDSGNQTLWLRPDILIEFVSLHDAKQKVGSGLDGIWIEEAARVAGDAWNGYIRQALADREGWAQFTTTPLGEDWTYEQLFKKTIAGTKDFDPDYSFFTWHMAHNVRVPEIVREAERLKKVLPKKYYQRECEASYQAFIGQIYEEFDDERMVHDELPIGTRLVEKIGAQDWGFTAPGAQIVLGRTSLNPDTAHVWAIDEEYSDSQLVEDFWAPSAKRLQQKHGFREWVGDPAEPDQILRMERAGVRMSGHRNRHQSGDYDEHARSVNEGIRAMTALMHQGRFHVLKRCGNLVSELRSYRWDETRTGTMIERPRKGQKDHAVTAMRYGVTNILRGASFEPIKTAA